MLIDQLKQHEGLRLRPYRCPAGYMTIGYGRNLDINGISDDEALLMLENDADYVIERLHLIDAYRSLPVTAKVVIANMAYNVGVVGCLGFIKMWRALASGDYKTAAAEMLDSKWANQVGKRATELAELLRSC